MNNLIIYLLAFIINISLISLSLLNYVPYYDFSAEFKNIEGKKVLNTKKMNNQKIYIGMTIDEFLKIFPDLDKNLNSRENIQLSRNKIINSLNGKWTFNFENGKLKWFMWDYYCDKINKQNFEKCLNAARKMISDYKIQYGIPCKEKEYDLVFKDPFVEHHWGYDVIESIWKTDRTKFGISFNFMGGKGLYTFIVKAEFYNKNYQYLDCE